MSVSTGGTGVSLGGGTGVSLGGIGVSVGGIGVSVGGMGVLLEGMTVFVGGIGVRVGGICVGILVGVNVGRARLVRVGVTVTKRLGVDVDVSDDRGAGESVSLGTSVCVGTNAVTTCSVSAAAVSKLETARSTILRGSIVLEMRLFKSPIAIADTLHKMLIPIAAAARTPKGPEYSLAFTLVVLLWRPGGRRDFCCSVISVVFY